MGASDLDFTNTFGHNRGSQRAYGPNADARRFVDRFRSAEHFGRRGVLVVISDFYDDPDAIVDAVQPLRFRGNDLIVFHVLDPTELEFGFSDAQPFEDLESGEQMPVVPEAFREEYRSLVKAHIDALTQAFSAVRVDYTLLDTSKPLDYALFRYLSARSKMMKSRF